MFDRYSGIDLFGPFYGKNWHAAELSDGLTYRWSGPETTSSLWAPSLGARELRIRWTFAFPPQEGQLDKLSWSVDGEPGPLNWSLRGGHAVLWGDFTIASNEPSLLVSLSVPERQWQPQEAPDSRTLGLAVHKLEVFALDHTLIGQQADELRHELLGLRFKLKGAEAQLAYLQGEVEGRDHRIDAMLNSTSWRVSSPLRWFARTLGPRKALKTQDPTKLSMASLQLNAGEP
jgi:hypothetical protein